MTQDPAREQFLADVAHVAEGSAWVAEEAWKGAPFADAAAMVGAFTHAVRSAPAGRQRDLIRAHPDLAGRAALAGELTDDSTAEQASAGLDRLTARDLEQVTRLNAAYRERFGFPFVICVRGRSVVEILEVWERRLTHDADSERAQAIEEIAAIIALRLEALA